MKKRGIIITALALACLFLISAETTFFQPGQETFILSGTAAINGVLLPISGNLGSYGEGYNYADGNYSNTYISDSVFYSIGRTNSNQIQNDLQGYIILNYNLASLNANASDINNLKLELNYCHSRDTNPPTICQPLLSGTTINSSDVSVYNFTSATYKTIGRIDASNGVQTIKEYNIAEGFASFIQDNNLKIRIGVEVTITQNSRNAVLALDYAPLNVTVKQMCIENWNANYSACNSSDVRSKDYTDLNNCGTFNNLPADNGAIELCEEQNKEETIGGGRKTLKVIDEQICEACFKSLQQQVKDKRSINYTSEEVAALTLSINKQFSLNLPKNKIESILTSFETECDRPLPLLAAVATGRYKEVINTSIVIVLTIVALLVIFIAIIVIIFIKNRIAVVDKRIKNKKKFKHSLTRRYKRGRR
jgi:hypothetical protein